MNLHNADIAVSAVKKEQYPKTGYPEFAFVGRSNVGKSSMVNKLLNRKSLARVSSTPGKTITINFYNIDDTIYLVDLPGYGYAKVAKTEKSRWADLMEHYFNSGRNLQLVCQLIDMRHPPTKDDIMMVNFLIDNELPFIVVPTPVSPVSPFGPVSPITRPISIQFVVSAILSPF